MRGLALGMGLLRNGQPLGHGPASAPNIDSNTIVLSASPTNMTGTANNAVDDYGVMVADTLLETVTNADHQTAIGVTITNGLTYYSDWVFRLIGRTQFRTRVGAGANNFYLDGNTVDLSAVATSGNLISWSMERIAGGFLHVRIKFAAVASSSGASRLYTAIPSANISFAGDITMGLVAARFTLSHD